MNNTLPVTGTYFTYYGAIHLELLGDRVEGTYSFQDGRLSGTLHGNRIQGTWMQLGNGREGTFTFDLEPGANGFSGTWRYADPSEGSGDWDGVRLELPSEEEGGFPGGVNGENEGPLLSGPMIGEVGERDARLWVQARSTAPLTLVVEAEDGEQRRITKTPAWSEWLCQVFHVEDLRRGVPYIYFFESEHGRTHARPLRLGPSATDRAARFAFGSCFHWAMEQHLPIFEAIAREAPACLAMIGDNTYYDLPDWQSEHTMMLAQLRARNNASFRCMAAVTPTLGVWDDHDFGPNDSDNHFEGKDASLRAFQRSWANARWGTPYAPGVFSSVRMGPAEIFLLDSRFYKDRAARCLLGDEQLDWLLDALEMSAAPVKIIASPTQVLAEAAVRQGWECFRADAPDEAASLMAAIEARDIRGVIFVSGDTHLANLFHRPGRAGKGACGPEWWELTTSPVANGPWQVSIAGEDPYLVHEVIDRCNYGIVDVDLDRARAEVLLVCKDERGGILFQQAIALETLAVRR